MATPRVLGQLLRLTANLCFARDASVEEIVSFPIYHQLSPNNACWLGVRFRSKRTQEGLVCPATASNDADHASRLAAHHLLRAGGQLDSGLALVGVVADDGDVVAGSPAEGSSVAGLLLHV